MTLENMERSKDLVSPLYFLCTMCEANCIDAGKGLIIENFALDNLPSKIQICKPCAEKLAVGLISGTFSLSGVAKIFSGLLFGGKKT
jgi:hypothetical protein